MVLCDATFFRKILFHYPPHTPKHKQKFSFLQIWFSWKTFYTEKHFMLKQTEPYWLYIFFQYHGGTNFGRTASAYVPTSYYGLAPLDEYGTSNSTPNPAIILSKQKLIPKIDKFRLNSATKVGSSERFTCCNKTMFRAFTSGNTYFITFGWTTRGKSIINCNSTLFSLPLTSFHD